jgi:hypothetical protein
MYRVLDVYIIKDNAPLRLSWSVAIVAGAGYDKRHEGVRAGGCGLDVGFALVYSLARVPAVGVQGLVVVWDKIFPLDEHGEEDARDDIPKPPYRVHVDQFGEIKCGCMAGNCKAPSCRHGDATLYLMAEGVFDNEPQGI